MAAGFMTAACSVCKPLRWQKLRWQNNTYVVAAEIQYMPVNNPPRMVSSANSLRDLGGDESQMHHS